MKHLLMGVVMTAAAFGAAAGDSIPYANTIRILPGDSPETIIAKAAHVVPTPNQAAGLDRGFIAFVHFGPNTFSKREWGTGKEDPALFNPTGLDTDQWVKAMKDAGMKMVMLTVKHHDGYVLWQSRYTDHGIMSSPFEGGKGDILRELSKSAAKYGLKLGVYLSPADLYQIENPEGLYGNLSKKTLRTIPRPVEGRPFANKTTFEFTVDDYNEYFLNQLFEILTEYGPVSEVWFDGAHPKRKGGQTYDYNAWRKLIRTLAPEAVIFGREDVRWCGNEAGRTRPTEWNVIPYATDPDTMASYPDLTAADLGSRERLAAGTYLHYQYPETDTSIREGWFYRDNTTQKVRSADEVFDIYERSVGGNSVLLLNIPPSQAGVLDSIDVAVLREVGRRIETTYATDLLDAGIARSRTADGTYIFDITFRKPATINRLMLREPVAKSGERIEEHTVEARLADGTWRQIASATNVGSRRILRFPDVTASALRVKVGSSRLTPELSEVTGHYYKAGAPALEARRNAAGYVRVAPLSSGFSWHGAPSGSPAEMLPDYTVRYTTDGSAPTASSPVMPDSLRLESVVFSAAAFLADGTAGPVMSNRFGLVKSAWTAADSTASAAFDENPSTAWSAPEAGSPLTIDLGAPRAVSSVGYTPLRSARGAVAKATVEVSTDGRTFVKAGEWDFGNLAADPTPRLFVLPEPATGRWLRIIPVETVGKAPASIAEIDIY